MPPDSFPTGAVARDFADVESAYERWAPVYDAVYGVLLRPGRRRAMELLRPRTRESILEVGVGTGIDLARYPVGCRVTGIDISAPMMARAAVRRRAQQLTAVSLCQMNVQQLGFADGVFDAVYAPYAINVMPDPVAAGREMVRVCRPGGRLVFLNHFAGTGRTGHLDRVVGYLATALTGVDWHLDLHGFLKATGLHLESIEAVNVPRVSCVAVCRAALEP